MKSINYSELKKFFAPQPKAESVADLLPLVIMLNGSPLFVLSKIEDTVILSDLHPRVVQQLKAAEAKARMGMTPKVLERVTLEKSLEG